MPPQNTNLLSKVTEVLWLYLANQACFFKDIHNDCASIYWITLSIFLKTWGKNTLYHLLCRDTGHIKLILSPQISMYFFKSTLIMPTSSSLWTRNIDVKFLYASLIIMIRLWCSAKNGHFMYFVHKQHS